MLLLGLGGMWIFDISSTAEGCRLNITKRAEMYNPVFRFAARSVLGYHRTLDTYLQNACREFEESSLPPDRTASAR